MRGLISLLSIPPPNMRYFAITGAVLIGLYLVLLPFDGALQRMGTSAFVLSNVLFMFGLMWWNMPGIRARVERVGLTTVGIGLGVCFSALSVVFLLEDPIWIQRFISLIFVLRVLVFAYSLCFEPPFLGELPWHAKYWDVGRENAARWEIVGCLMLLLLLEIAVAYGSLDQWMGVRVAAPAFVHALKWWTICVTHPYEDGDG